MAPSIVLRRLLDLRQAEEERSELELERASQALHQLEAMLIALRERRVGARLRVASSAETGEVIDRIAGLQALEDVDRLKRAILKRIEKEEKEVHRKRQEVLNSRIARKQVETVVDARSVDARLEATRRSQSALDDWYLTQKFERSRRTS